MSITRRIIRKARRILSSGVKLDNKTYEKLYQAHALTTPAEISIGAGDFQMIGELEKAILRMEGLKTDSALFDFGCGVGRLAIQVIPEMQKGKYYGSDISTAMLENAGRFIKEKLGNTKCQVKFLKQTGYDFKIPPQSIDIICAFSVFTHMEHEDAFKYLQAAKKIVKVNGKFIFSCLPIHLDLSKKIFKEEASLNFKTRWSKIRNITTSIELMESISHMAGWRVQKWFHAEKPNIYLAGNEKPFSLGQSVCVLQS